MQMWVRNRLILLLLGTGAAAVVGLVGLVAVTKLVGYGDDRAWLFFVPVIPGVTGLVCAAWMRKDSSSGKAVCSHILLTMTRVMSWLTGCSTALSMTVLLLFVLFVAAICASGVQ